MNPVPVSLCSPDSSAQRGSIMLATMIMMYLAAFGVASILGVVNHDVKMTHQYNNEKRALAAAEAGLDNAILELRSQIIEYGAPTQAELDTITPPVISGYQFNTPSGDPAYRVQADGAYRQSLPILEGRWAGLKGDTQRYVIRVGVTNAYGQGMVLTHSLQRVTIPVFQFGVFYESDLEIQPGPALVFAGAVHTNDDLYLGSDGSSALYDSLVTSVGNIYRRRKDSNTYTTGNVSIKDAGGAYRDLKLGSSWLEHTTTDWSILALQRWNGRVCDSAHKVPYLRLPIPLSETPDKIKELQVSGGNAILEAQKLHSKAAVIITCNSSGTVSAKLADGTNFPLTYTKSGSTVSYTSKTTFGDYRESTTSSAKTMQTLDIDIGKLIAHPNFPTTDGNVVYIYNAYQPSGNKPVIRLKNGSLLPTYGLTIASYNPVYIQGNYNSSGTAKPSLVCGDAINILSNDWSDADSTTTLSAGKRKATATTVKTVIMAGNTNTSTGAYNGGLENLMRFLEDWGGVTFTYRGSILCLWNSRISTGGWGKSNVYKPPNRDWAYDEMYRDPHNAPPGIPAVYGLEALTWSRSSWTQAELL